MISKYLVTGLLILSNLATSFAAISGRNGISITSSSTINGKTPNSAINGISLASGSSPTTFNALGNNAGSTTGATSYATTGSYTPTANAVVFACVVNSKASAPDLPTFSGNGLTWVQILTYVYGTADTPTRRITVFRAMGASPSNGAGTASFGATQTGCIVNVVEAPNVDTSGTNGSGAIGQLHIKRADSTSNPNALLGALTGSANSVITFTAHSINSTAYGTAEASWTESNELAYNTPATGLVTGYRLATTDNSIAVTGASADWCAVAIEIRASGAAGEAFEGTKRYVDAGSTVGGDGTTSGTGGSNRAFVSMRDALESLTQWPYLLPNAYVIYCGGTTADTEDCDHPGDFLTSSVNYIRIVGNNTTGKWNTSAYRMEVTNESGFYNNLASHIRMENLQIQVTVTDTGSSYNCYRLSTANNDSACYFVYKNCIAKGVFSGGGTSTIIGYAESVNGADFGGVLYRINSYAYDCTTGFSSDDSDHCRDNVYSYNCGSYGNGYGWVGLQKAINCIGYGHTLGDAFVATGTTGHSNNASDDGSAGGTGARTGQTFTFVNAGADDFHLASGDTGAKDFGTSSVGGLFTDDIDGQTRSGSWDIGPDEYVP